MMEFNFNTFLGFENSISEKPEIVVMAAFFIPIIFAIVLSFIGFIFRKLKLNMYIIYALLYTLLFTFLFGLLAIFILFIITERTGVKLAYCWLIILIGMFIFSIINTKSLNKMFSDWSKTKKHEL